MAGGRAAKRPKASRGTGRSGTRRGLRRSARAIPPQIPLRTEESIEPLPANFGGDPLASVCRDEGPRETPASSLSSLYRFERPPHAGAHPEGAGQAGDTEDLRKVAVDSPQSVEELVEEGQDFEAEIVDAIENVPPADVSAVPRPRQPKPRKGRPPTL
jgi:hypothetical protein